MSKPTTDITPTDFDLQQDMQHGAETMLAVLPHLADEETILGVKFTLAACRRALAAESELAQLYVSAYCAYCGHTEPIDGDGEGIAQHIRTCEKHPMRATEARVKELEALLCEVQQKLIRDSDWAGPSAPSYVLISDYIRREMGQKIEEVLR